MKHGQTHDRKRFFILQLYVDVVLKIKVRWTRCHDSPSPCKKARNYV
nr:MAG TPA: hypothetical protein [Caudoviricetes sp.]